MESAHASSSARRLSMTTRRVCVLFLAGSVATTLWVAGCASQADRNKAALEMLTKEHQLRESSPKTTVWIDNRTDDPIRRVGMSCKSAPRTDKSRLYASSWTREAARDTTVEGGPKEIWSEKFPDPLVLEKLELWFDKGGHTEHQLN